MFWAPDERGKKQGNKYNQKTLKTKRLADFNLLEIKRVARW